MPRVLLIEDERIVAEIYSLALQRAGLEVMVAPDGAEGLRLAQENKPDFIFLDVRMPRMGGMDVLRSLAAGTATSAIPTVMMTNYDDPATVRSSRDLGAKEYLVKAGFDPNDLAAIVERWVAPPVA
ncbi:MAG TPA: response regulator [Candidatus Dormibacteraeota bacterium]|nr:response regulator [Candidatus Dormibacteraeota bacterium]